MKKRTRRHRSHRSRQARYRTVTPFVWIRGWMFVVAFALMLGLGAILGTFFNAQLNITTPQVAGVQTEAR